MIHCPEARDNIECQLEAKHRGYHWGKGPQGQPFPWASADDKGLLRLGYADPTKVFPLHVGFFMAYCPAKSRLEDGQVVECEMRWHHPGPHGCPGWRWERDGQELRASLWERVQAMRYWVFWARWFKLFGRVLGM